MTNTLIQVPTELRKILLDFTLSCLLERPTDYAEHGLQYFEKLIDCRTQIRKSRKSSQNEEDEIDNDSNRSVFDMRAMASRRASVVAERYNPEDDSDSGDIVVIPKADEDRKKLIEDVKDVLIFRSLDNEELSTILDAMKLRVVSKDEVVIRQGEVDADSFYVIHSGTFEASIISETGETKVLRTYYNEGSFGELALLYKVPRAATVTATTDGRLWVLGRETFRKIVLKSAFVKRERYQKLIEQVNFLKILSSYAKLDLADSLVPKHYVEKEVVFRQGDVADGMYFIEFGGIDCLVEHPLQGDVLVNQLTAGGFLGELALITHNRRALTAIANTDTKLAFLDKEAFERLLGPCTEFLTKHFSEYELQMVDAVGSATSVYYHSSASGD